MRLKDTVFIRLQSAHRPICLWDNYPTYSMYCTLCTAIVQHCAAIAQCAVIMSNAQSYDSCAVMTLTVHVSCTYWDDTYYRVYLYLIYDQ